jgi:hypothetical protein
MLFIDTASAARSKVIMNNGGIKIWKVTLALNLRPYADSILDKLRKTKLGGEEAAVPLYHAQCLRKATKYLSKDCQFLG